MESLVNIILNFPLKKYVAYTDYAVDGATLAITAGTIVTATLSFIRQSITGFSQELQPVISYNYGAGKKDGVKKAQKQRFDCLLIKLYTTFVYN